MPSKSYSNDNLPSWQPQESFSLVDFLAEAPDYFAREPFTIHVDPRSDGIHEFLNLQIQLKVARLIRLKKQVLQQMKAYKKRENPILSASQTPSTSSLSNPSSKTENISAALSSEIEGNLVYKKGKKTFKIVVSPEQMGNYFETDSTSAETQKSESEDGLSRNKDIFDRFLREPGFFKRSKDPESIPPDASIEASVTEDEDVVTETLAKIHRAQGNHSEARRIYHKLSLLFPEKSAYFEAQIEILQDLDTKNDA